MSKGFEGFHNAATAKWMKENEPHEYTVILAEKRIEGYKAKYITDGVNQYTGELLTAACCALDTLITTKPGDALTIQNTKRVLEHLALAIETSTVIRELKN